MPVTILRNAPSTRMEVVYERGATPCLAAVVRLGPVLTILLFCWWNIPGQQDPHATSAACERLQLNKATGPRGTVLPKWAAALRADLSNVGDAVASCVRYVRHQ